MILANFQVIYIIRTINFYSYYSLRTTKINLSFSNIDINCATAESRGVSLAPSHVASSTKYNWPDGPPRQVVTKTRCFFFLFIKTRLSSNASAAVFDRRENYYRRDN